MVLLVEKDNVIEKLHKKLHVKNKFKSERFRETQTSILKCSTAIATAGKSQANITSSREYILANLHSIPRFNVENFQYSADITIGSGMFGDIKVS